MLSARLPLPKTADTTVLNNVIVVEVSPIGLSSGAICKYAQSADIFAHLLETDRKRAAWVLI